MKLYNFLVNRHSGIRERYHKYHDQGGNRFKSYGYLLWLNLSYYLGGRKALDIPAAAQVYESTVLLVEESESEWAGRLHPGMEEYVERLSACDVVSFDIFDTLLFRPFSEPTDLFYFLGAQLGRMDFKRIRMEQEYFARKECHARKGHYEVTFSEIWERIERETGISAVEGMETEQALEEKFCYANPFMKGVFEQLRRRGKRIIAVSDMYLPGAFLEKLLEENGFTGIEKVYVSCEYGCNKGSGKLYELVRRECASTESTVSVIHVGDNQDSDVRMAQRAGFGAIHYPNVNGTASRYRAHDMSPVVGGAYRGIVNSHLFQGTKRYSMAYEYGFIYGGLFVTGYCGFIHEYCQVHRVDKLLFLSRDGDIIKQAYDRMYPGEKTEYVYWSRAAAVKLMAGYDRYDYFKRYLTHKTNQRKTIREVLGSMELFKLAEALEGDEGIPLHLEDELTGGNAETLKKYLLEHFREIEGQYREQSQAAAEYFGRMLAGCSRACAVDIGWAGSGAMAMAYLVERVWKLPCEITGIIAGTNTVHNAEPDASEIFLQSGRLTAYLYSHAHNRDVMKKHDPNKDYNLYWELLVSSPTRQFLGFGFEEDADAADGRETGTERGDARRVKLCFGGEDGNQAGIREIQRGILEFVEAYCGHFGDYPYMFRISGRDAYAPMLLAACHEERYLKAVAKQFPDFFNSFL